MHPTITENEFKWDRVKKYHLKHTAALDKV